MCLSPGLSEILFNVEQNTVQHSAKYCSTFSKILFNVHTVDGYVKTDPAYICEIESLIVDQQFFCVRSKEQT